MRKILQFTIAAAIILYGLQLFTPLRLTSDGIVYLSFADGATRSGLLAALREPGFPLPKGYPVFAFLLMKAGIFGSYTLVLSNLVLFGVGLFFCFRTLVTLGIARVTAQVVCVLTMLSFAAVKFITQGMSDFLFFALASAVCWLLTLERHWKWVPVLLCTVCAIEVRFIGIALLVPAVVAAWPVLRRHPLVMGAAACCALSFGIAGLLAGHQYLGSNARMFINNGPVRFVIKTFLAHCQDFGELVTNMPLSKLPQNVRPLILLIGAGAMGVFFQGVVAIRRHSPWLCAYLLAFSALVLPWPYTDPRFWLPVMPFVLVAFAEGVSALTRYRSRWLARGYAAAFCTLGFFALAYSTSLTFAGPQFAFRYGDGTLTKAYLANCRVSDVGGEQDALRLLQKYEWHCPQSN